MPRCLVAFLLTFMEHPPPVLEWSDIEEVSSPCLLWPCCIERLRRATGVDLYLVTGKLFHENLFRITFLMVKLYGSIRDTHLCRTIP